MRAGGGAGEVGWAGGRAVALEMELEEVEESAGDEGAQDQASSALDYALQWDYQSHDLVW